MVVAVLRGVVLDGQAATGLNATDLRRKDRPDTGTGRLRRGVRQGRPRPGSAERGTSQCPLVLDALDSDPRLFTEDQARLAHCPES